MPFTTEFTCDYTAGLLLILMRYLPDSMHFCAAAAPAMTLLFCRDNSAALHIYVSMSVVLNHSHEAASLLVLCF